MPPLLATPRRPIRTGSIIFNQFTILVRRAALAAGLGFWAVLLAGAAPLEKTPHTGQPALAAAPEIGLVKVTTKHEADGTHFFVENQEFGEITMTFEMNVVNLKANVRFPYSATFAPRQTSEAFVLAPCDPDAKWEYSYTNYYKLGSNCARHDDSYTYGLPFAAGARFKVTQGYNGKFSHKGSNQYAIDWQMPEGTVVFAARGGVVVRVKDDSDEGGPSMDYDRYNNYVLIRHSDGTLGHYCHLQRGGCLVKPGQVVAAGQPIAHSGNTGFSSGPHLHFSVFKTKNGRERLSIPVKFHTAADESLTLVAGHWYRAPGTQTASARVNAPVVNGAGASAP